jgi:hypothetical protein
VGLCLLASLLTVGCSRTAVDFWDDRFLDLLDTTPFSLANGRGVAAHVRMTPCPAVGAGYADTWRFGVDEGRVGPFWYERTKAIPVITYTRYQFSNAYPPSYMGVPDIGGEGFERHIANSLIFIPARAESGGMLPPLLSEGSGWERTRWSWWDAGKVEAEAFAGVIGVRLGFAPLQAVDLLLGFLTLDPAGDDWHSTCPTTETEVEPSG